MVSSSEANQHAVTSDGDDIFVDGVRYKGTLDLWELMVKKKPESFEPEVFKTLSTMQRS
jgi:hypothetical protein